MSCKPSLGGELHSTGGDCFFMRILESFKKHATGAGKGVSCSRNLAIQIFLQNIPEKG